MAKDKNKKHVNFYLGHIFAISGWYKDYSTAEASKSKYCIKLGTVRVEIRESELYKSLYN